MTYAVMAPPSPLPVFEINEEPSTIVWPVTVNAPVLPLILLMKLEFTITLLFPVEATVAPPVFKGPYWEYIKV